MNDLADDELAITIKSLSISYDAFTRKLDRLWGHWRDEAIDELEVCNRTLAKLKQAQTERWRAKTGVRRGE